MESGAVPVKVVRGLLSEAVAVGATAAVAVRAEAVAVYGRWIASGMHDGLEYLERYKEVRDDPRLLLKGARSIIMAAFPYPRPTDIKWAAGALRIASYALGDDYHEVVRQRLESAASALCSRYGGEFRVCADTAPLRERYWAVEAGLGFIGMNGLLIVPGAGSCCVLGAIVTTLDIENTPPCHLNCGYCRRCLVYCPAKAIKDVSGGGTTVDSRLCISCQTIERREPLPDGFHPGDRLYGCDTCQTACPHNRTLPAPEALPEFMPRPGLLSLTREAVAEMTQEEYSLMFRHSAIKRAKLAGLQRNAAATGK